MKKILTIFVFAMFVLSMGFVLADGDQLKDGTGEMHDGIVAAGGQNGEPMLLGAQGGMMYANKRMAKEGTYRNAENKEVKIQRFENKLQIRSGEHSATCPNECNLTQEEFENRTRLYSKLSNGRNAEVKIMPDVASERALERLNLKNCVEAEGCTMELKEVGVGEGSKLAYELKRDRKAKFLGFIGTRMNVKAQVDAETGEVIKTRKPWWSFLASEPAEVLE